MLTAEAVNIKKLTMLITRFSAWLNYTVKPEVKWNRKIKTK